MAIVSAPKTWVDNENVTYTDLNNSFSTIYNDHNGNIDNSNVSSSAAIVESKISFNTSTGHSHNGTDSKGIPKGFVWNVYGYLAVDTDPAPWLVVTATQTITKAYAVVKTAPTGAGLIVDIEKSSDNGSNWVSIWNTNVGNRLTIAAGSKTGTQTSFDSVSIVEGDLLRIAIDQIGSSIVGSDLTVILKA